jgi:hypothetical protein
MYRPVLQEVAHRVWHLGPSPRAAAAVESSRRTVFGLFGGVHGNELASASRRHVPR